MITLTSKAIARIEQFIQSDPKKPELFRVVVRGQDKDGFMYEFLLQKSQALLASDKTFSTGSFTTVVDEGSFVHMSGATIDWMDSVQGSGFKVDNPNKPFKIIENPTLDVRCDFVENDINPAIAQHNGYAEVIKFEDNKVYVKMGGGCQGCSSAAVTLRMGIEDRIKEVFPSIAGVVDTTDHNAGTNPYYK
ncbi:MAG: iron-sulfur cluster assembly accessory protein [Bdellovibrionota bacterium]